MDAARLKDRLGDKVQGLRKSEMPPPLRSIPLISP